MLIHLDHMYLLCLPCFSCRIKFIYSEKATKFCEIFILLLSYVVSLPVNSKVKLSQDWTWTIYNIILISHVNLDFFSFKQKDIWPLSRCSTTNFWTRSSDFELHLIFRHFESKIFSLFWFFLIWWEIGKVSWKISCYSAYSAFNFRLSSAVVWTSSSIITKLYNLGNSFVILLNTLFRKVVKLMCVFYKHT